MTAGRSCAGPRGQLGLTLVELLVVLFLLALLAGTASVATAGLVEQGQQDATVRSLEAVVEATTGTPGRTDALGRVVVTGFVADMGRLPHAGVAGAQLAELWGHQTATFAYRAPVGDPDVVVGCGWRGPYLRLGSALSTAPQPLLDAWGQPFVGLLADGTTEAGATEPVAIVRSRGADAAAGGAGTAADLDAVFAATGPPPVDRWTGTLTLRIVGAGPTAELTVRVFGPADAGAVTLRQVPADSAASPLVADGAGGAVVTIANVPIGPRVVRVYEAKPPDDPATPVPASVRSAPQPVVIVAGANPEFVVVMPGS